MMTILEEARHAVFTTPDLRLGQAVWNAAVHRCPAVRFLAGSALDPFYDDTRIRAFLARIRELWSVE